MSDPDRDKQWSRYDELGESEVRYRLEMGRMSEINARSAQAWLATKERAAAEADRNATAKKDRRDTFRFWVSHAITATSAFAVGYLFK